MLAYKALWATATGLGGKFEKMESERKRPAVQFDEQEEDAKVGEDDKMEVDEEAGNRKKKEMRKRDIIDDVRKWEGIKCFDEKMGTCREDWQKELA